MFAIYIVVGLFYLLFNDNGTFEIIFDLYAIQEMLHHTFFMEQRFAFW